MLSKVGGAPVGSFPIRVGGYLRDIYPQRRFKTLFLRLCISAVILLALLFLGISPLSTHLILMQDGDPPRSEFSTPYQPPRRPKLSSPTFKTRHTYHSPSP